MRCNRALAITALAGACSAASGEIVRPDSAVVFAAPGTQVRSVWVVAEAHTALFGYSLDVDRTAGAGAGGSASVSASLTTFYPPRNVYLAAGHDLDPFFSDIEGDAAGGVFVNTNAADFASVLPVAGVNDALAELVIELSPDASGEFVFSLGPSSALSDAAGFAVPFTAGSLTVRVVPAPNSSGVAVIALLAVARRRRR